ncbi:MAG: DUF1707 and DUF2154 domain-containing protein [Gemmatimonadaceae bacterium]|nr:DUF1707 and DUF2154 domain-containing protein [Gemmatimonadaceae bacterium]
MSLDLERERIVQALCSHYAQDHLTTGELERRFELVYAAQDRQALVTVLEGLPAISRNAALAPNAPAPMPTYDAPARSSGLRDSEKRYVAFFAEVKKEGAWRAPSFARVRAVLGTVVLDLREADIPPEGMDIDAEAILGEVKVILPLGIGADVDCTAMLAEVVDKAQAGAAGLPMVRVRGGATLGTISVVTKLPKKDRLEEWRLQLRSWFGGPSDPPRLR